MRKFPTLILILLLRLATGPARTFAADEEAASKFPDRCSTLLGHVAEETIPKDLLKAVSELKYGGEIPPHLFTEYDSRAIGEAIVRWVAKREEILKPALEGSVEVDFLNQSQLMLHFKPIQTESIWTTAYKNQHETGYSYGAYVPTIRIAAEDTFTGLKMADTRVARPVRPKSSFLHISEDADIGKYRRASLNSQYGYYVAVLKDDVKRRSLWVLGDSLGIGKLSYPDEVELMAVRGSFYRGSLSLLTHPEGGSHIEAVTYGEIGLQDVDHFLVFQPDGSPFNGDELKRFGLPIFSAKEASRRDRQHYVYTQLLQRGTKLPESMPPGEWVKFELALKSDSAEIDKTVAAISTPHPVISEAEAEVEPGLFRKKYLAGVITKNHSLRTLTSYEGSSALKVSAGKLSPKGWGLVFTQMKSVSNELEKWSIPHAKRATTLSSEMLIFLNPKKDQLVSELKMTGAPAERRKLIESVKQLLTDSASRKLYLSGFRPEDTLLTGTGLQIIFLDGVKEMKSSEAAYTRTIEKIDSHWGKTLTAEELEEIRDFLRSENRVKGSTSTSLRKPPNVCSLMRILRHA